MKPETSDYQRTERGFVDSEKNSARIDTDKLGFDEHLCPRRAGHFGAAGG